MVDGGDEMQMRKRRNQRHKCEIPQEVTDRIEQLEQELAQSNFLVLMAMVELRLSQERDREIEFNDTEYNSDD